MSIGREEIRRLADLARLALTPAEETEVGEQLNTCWAQTARDGP
jgi:Asp-tRNA(Asn)/Glu-tRNA(Gln) amidotransferase C subunit